MKKRLNLLLTTTDKVVPYLLLTIHLFKMRLILYSKPGCHLCEALQAKLEQISAFSFELEVRDITARAAWFQAYEYEVPVILIDTAGQEQQLPRPSPRATVSQLEQMIQKYTRINGSE